MRYKMPVTAEQYTEINKRNTKSQDKEKLEKELGELSKLASSAVSEAVRKEYGAEYLKPDETTDEELLKRAEESAKQKIASEKDELVRDNEKAVGALNEKAETENKNLVEAKKNIKERYDSAKKSASDDALKRGLGRSSIIVNLLKEYDADKLKTIDEKDQKYGDELKKINDEITELNAELKASLDKADMREAFEINEKLTELKSERDNANEKVVKYNNSLAEKLGELKKQLENSSTRGHVIVEAERLADEYNNQMLKKIIGYYSNLSDDEIKKDFEDGKYDGILSPDAYRKLQTYVNNKR